MRKHFFLLMKKMSKHLWSTQLRQKELAIRIQLSSSFSVIPQNPLYSKLQKKEENPFFWKLNLTRTMESEAGKNGESLINVKVTGKTHVKPKKKLGKKEHCQLVTFDLRFLAIDYSQKLLFYKGNNYEEMVEKLKDGLEVVLVEFYQMAGKLGKDEEGVFRIEYDDQMEGVEVVEAVADEISTEDLSAEKGTNAFKDLIPYGGILNFEGTHRRLLAVQLTKLKDGLAVGCAFNHAILDGTSTWHFMSSWAEICSGSPTISVLPFLDRTKSCNTRVKFDIPPPPSDRNATSNGGSSNPQKATSNGKAEMDPPLRERVFKFSETSIDKIKLKLNASSSSSSSKSSDSSKPFSTFQSLSVHIWRHVTTARDLKPEDVTVFTVFANCRKRVDPPMPESYFGNLIQAIFTGTAAGLLMANPPEFGAALIQRAIEAHDAKAIEDRNRKWEKEPKIFTFKDAGVNCLVVGSSPKFKVYDVDFGWGKPEGVRSGSNNRFDGMVYLHQGKSGTTSIDVDITLEAGAMERLEKDKEFLMEV